ncbi:DUF397 domain-containing protein [Streptomyces sp. NPDC014646]|uniref:DUF397 domain-containing protein n=1 Tax=Streptomyces sp. NPDC014646 TaxID=3364877 RepID=UPI0037034F55
MIRNASAGDNSELAWFKSSYSDTSNPNDCVEVATTPHTVHVRDSKNVPGPLFTVAPGAWSDFVTYAAQH